jgi:O-antigen/teichoic acid export membrane protein
MDIKQSLKSILKSEYFGTTILLTSGAVLEQIISIFSAPISSRIFSAENYGGLGVYMAITGVLGTLTSSHYPQAVLIAKEEDEARNLIWFCGFLAAAISIVIGLAVCTILFFTDWLDALGFWTFTIPFSIMLSAIIRVLSVWANRTKQYKIISKNRVATALFTISIQLAVGYFINKKFGLMAGFLTGQIIGAVLLIRPFLFQEEIKIGLPCPKYFKRYAQEYRRFVIYGMPADFINSLINQLPVYFLNSMAGLSYVGNFSFAQRLLGLPTLLIGNSIADVFRQKAGEVYRKKGECSELFIKTGRILFLIGIIPLIIMLLFAPEIFAIVFGEQWRKAGEIARILSPLFFFRIIVSPLSYLYTLSGHMREDLIIHLGSLGVITGGFIVTNHFFSNKDFLLAGYSTAYFGIYLIYLTRSFQFSKGN